MMLAITLVLLLALLALVSYMTRVHTEMGKFLSREFQDNIDAYEELVEPKLGALAARSALSFAVLTQLTVAACTMVIVFPLYRRAEWGVTDLLESLFTVLLAIVIFHHILPFILFSRTKGRWLVHLVPVLKILIVVAMPVTLVLGFCLSVAALSKDHAAPEPEDSQEAVDAFIEAGRDEGIIEESDRDLIQSVVEFGDKTVREVMTPRPQIFAVPADTTVEQFIALLRERRYSRVPVYQKTLDDIKGVVFTHDILQVADTEARTRTVGSLIKDELLFVPESKRGSDLLRELQRENVHMAIVIDEYGGVAGLVTIEDLVEEIVGEIRDEHEADADIVQESPTAYVVPGNTDVDMLEDLFHVRPDNREATTIGGLVSEICGRIPQPGEVVQDDGLRFQVLASTDRYVERVRVSVADPIQSVNQ